MKRRWIIIVVGALAWRTLPGAASADGLLYQLPKDRTWATYDVSCTAKAGGSEMTAKGTLRMASVGQWKEKDQACRWIEVQFDMETRLGDEKRKMHETCKVLIPEKDLAKGQSPMAHVIRAYRQTKLGATPEKMKNPGNADISPLPLILSGPWQNTKPRPAEKIEGKFGTLACEGIDGTLKFPTALKPGGVIRCKLANRLNSDAPFGVVTSHWLITTPGGSLEWDLKLAKSGTDAVTKMPDAK